MANIYNVDYSDKSVDLENKQPIVIAPGQWDTSTSLSLPGYSAALYGEHIAENFIHLMENFASETQPDNATLGQLWYVPSLKALKVLIKITTVGQVKTYTWRVVGAISNTTTPPDDTSSLWYDTSNANPALWQLKIYNTGNSTWMSVADRYVIKAGDTITGSLKVGALEVGLTSNIAVNGTTSGFFPGFNGNDTHMRASNSVAIMFAGSAAANKQFILTTATNPAAADDVTKIVLSAQQNGMVKIYRGTLDMSANKITSLANGSAPADGVNFAQLTDVSTRLQQQISVAAADLENRKVNRSGDTMTGALTVNAAVTVNGGVLTVNNSGITVNNGGLAIAGNGAYFSAIGPGVVVAGVGQYTAQVRATAQGVGGLYINGVDTSGNAPAIHVVNGYGPGGTLQSMFSVMAYTGNVGITGQLNVAKNAVINGSVAIGAISTMDAPITAITNPRHLATKEYVDLKIASTTPTENYARVNPAAPRDGDILVSGGANYIYNAGWRQVYPAQWAG